MGLEDFRNKNEKDFTAEDFFCKAYDEDFHPFIHIHFFYGDYCFMIWEDWTVIQYNKKDIKEHSKFFDAPKIAIKKYDDFDIMMLDKFWGGLSLSDMMRHLSPSDLK